MDLIKFFQSGGFFMYPIVVVMGIGLAISIERFLYLTVTQSKTNKIWKNIVPSLKARDYEHAKSIVESIQTPLSTVLQYGLARLSSKSKESKIEAAMEEGIMEVIPELEQRTHYLATLANIATLIGLLGTIIGLIQAFTAVAGADPAEKADLLSASISVAMNTTAFGLTAAIPLILLHSYLATRTSKLVDNIEMAAVKSLNIMTEE